MESNLEQNRMRHHMTQTLRARIVARIRYIVRRHEDMSGSKGLSSFSNKEYNHNAMICCIHSVHRLDASRGNITSLRSWSLARTDSACSSADRVVTSSSQMISESNGYRTWSRRMACHPWASLACGKQHDSSNASGSSFLAASRARLYHNNSA